MRTAQGLAIAVALLTAAAGAETQPLAGNWRSPTGSIIKVAGCGNGGVCLTLMQVEKTAPGRVDHNNPDPQLRHRSLCGLRIGEGFKPADGGVKADGGSIYDPKSGRTYRGSLALDGDELKLRGYLGLKLLGRTEEWTRVNGPVTVCR